MIHICIVYNKYLVLFIVTENQGQPAVTTNVPSATKQSTGSFSISSQPFSRLGWNTDVRAKQEEVSLNCI